MTFRVGQKVVCISDPVVCNGNPVQPTIGAVYTVRAVFVSDTGIPSVRLRELIAPLHISGVEYGYVSRRFRPIVERKTDISIFTKMLTGKRVDA